MICYRLLLVGAFIFYSPILFAQITDFWNIDFSRADSIAFAYAGTDLKNPEKLAENLTQGLATEPEKFRAIYRWIANDISYDYKLYFKDVRKREKLRFKRAQLKKWQEKRQRISYSHTLKQKKALCWGYALLLEYMSNHVGVACKMIHGYGRTMDQKIGSGSVNHAWNAVRLDGEWYLCDATWSSSAYDVFNQRMIKRFEEVFFLTEPNLFAVNHFPSDTSWLLMYDKPRLQEFLNAPHRVGGYLRKKVNQFDPVKGRLHVKEFNCITFQFSVNTESGEVQPELAVVEKNGRVSEMSTFNKNRDGVFVNQHYFESKGNKKVYVIMDDHVLMIYDVLVN